MPIEPITRTISGKGIIRIPSEFLQAREIFLYAQVLRENSTVYRNENVNPSESFFANITFCKDDFVLQRYSMDYDNQMWEVYSSQSSQNLLALICALDNVLDSFVSFALALGFVYTRNNSITDFPYASFTPNTIRFKCYGSTAIILTLDGNELTRCDEGDGSPSPPPPPPPPVTKVPPGTPVDVTPAYDGDNDNGDTVPNPIDEDAPPPGYPVGDCDEIYTVTVVLFDSNFNPGGEFSQSFDVYAPITNVVKRPSATDPANADIVIQHNTAGCAGEAETSVVSNDNPNVVIQDVSFVLLP